MKRIPIFFFALMPIVLADSITLYAQEKVKGPLKIGLAYTQVDDALPQLKMSTKMKVGKRFEPVEAVEISVFFIDQTPENFVGKAITSDKGSVSIELPAEFKVRLDTIPTLTFLAVVASSDRFEETRSEIEITKARVALSLSEVDSIRKIDATVMAWQEGKWQPLPETEIKLFVKRLFSDLAIGDGAITTDGAGSLSADFSIVIPGDPEGNLVIGAKIDESDTYGTVVSTKSVKWGTPMKADTGFYSNRSLWATRDKTPVWLLIFPNLIIAGVWGVIFYLVYLIVRIRRIGIMNKH